MYGSDEPLNLIRAADYENPQLGQRLITDYPYHWVDPIEQKAFHELATGLTHAHWQCLSAIKSAVEHLPAYRQREAKRRIFHANAEAYFGF